MHVLAVPFIGTSQAIPRGTQ